MQDFIANQIFCQQDGLLVEVVAHLKRILVAESALVRLTEKIMSPLHRMLASIRRTYRRFYAIIIIVSGNVASVAA